MNEQIALSPESNEQTVLSPELKVLSNPLGTQHSAFSIQDSILSASQLAELVDDFSLRAKKLLANEALFHSLVEKSSESLLMVGKEGGKILYANPAAEKLFYAAPGELMGQLFGHPIREGEVGEIDVVHSRHRKTTAEMHVTPLEWNGEAAWLLSLRATAERHRLKNTLHKNTDRLNALINASPLAIVAVDMSGCVTLWNQAASRTFGWSEVDVLGQPLPLMPAPGGKESLQELVEQALHGEVLYGRELAGQQRCDGSVLDLQLWTSPLHNSQEITHGAMIFAVDITERKRTEKQLLNIAGIDVLTGLANRSQFRERLRQAIERVKHGDQPPFAVMHLGLDRFKAINQSLGHAMGDQLLREAAKRLADTLYDSDLVARTGGDEFSILLRDIRHVRDGARIAQKLLDSVAAVILTDGGDLYATASIGIAVYQQDGTDAEALLHSADTAMQRAKERGGGTSQFYTEDLDLRAREQLGMESDLHHAYERGEFKLYYQPQVNPINGRIVGVEALLRWFHPENGSISPAQFIPLAERSGMIIPIGEWVLRTACAQAQEWVKAGLPPVRVAVNLSARQLEHPQLVPSVADALRESGLDPAMLELELTESMLVKNTEDIVAVMHVLKKMGVQLSLDDFGTGYSALSYLARLPLDTLKIDQSFVRGIGQNPTNDSISIAIIALARSLGLKTIAEGVETLEQAEFLVARDCDEIQGYFFSHPLPAEECTALLTAGAVLPSRLSSPTQHPAPGVWRQQRQPGLMPGLALAD
ncbi:MAG: EAL domain-containing protein [Sulfuricella sp.]|nr:EAL domain-containing protein [Sulfuricella sp.]